MAATTLYPVVLCGGAGARLWPSSRPSRPKQFLPLIGDHTPFQETVLRAAPLAGRGRLLVAGSVAHRAVIRRQLDQLGVAAHLILEPEGRDSAPAVAVVAAWTRRCDPSGVNVFLPADHHVPDAGAFRRAALQAARLAGRDRIVALGLRPAHASSAYGYISPAGHGPSVVGAFVEKPDPAAAERLIAAGALWNSGVLVASAETLTHEIQALAPDVAAAAMASLPDCTAASATLLSPAFLKAPRLSIDHAVMERTRRAWVLPVDFDWSDLGAWDAVAARGRNIRGACVLEDAEDCLAHAGDGMVVAAIGVRNLAIVAERDAVLVCDLSRAQDVKAVVARLRSLTGADAATLQAATPDFPQTPLE